MSKKKLVSFQNYPKPFWIRFSFISLTLIQFLILIFFILFEKLQKYICIYKSMASFEPRSDYQSALSCIIINEILFPFYSSVPQILSVSTIQEGLWIYTCIFKQFSSLTSLPLLITISTFLWNELRVCL